MNAKRKNANTHAKRVGVNLRSASAAEKGPKCRSSARQIAATATQRGGHAALMDGFREEATGLRLPRSCLVPPPVSAACQRRQLASEHGQGGRSFIRN